jgi:squalene-hopene/tetraprenyl-beta-curcumene cyclase
MTSPDVDRALGLAVRHCRDTQHPQGHWATDPDPRVTETALACFALSRLTDTRSTHAVDRARNWLRHNAPQDHHPAARLVESTLRSIALAEDEPVDLRAAVFEDEALSARGTLLHVIATCAGRHVLAPRSLDELTVAVRRRCAAQEKTKPWSRLELLAIHALLQHRAGHVRAARQAVQAIAARQDADGSCYGNPITTCLAFLAMDTVSPGTGGWTAAHDYLLTGQRADGTWRFCTSDVWDTTLTVRAYHGVPAFAAHCLPAAVDFLVTAQNPDGGWPFRRGVESDNDTTGAALIALAGQRVPRGVVERAVAYLRAQQTEDGLWRTWQALRDPPTEDVVAHVRAALREHAPNLPVAQAGRWLADRWHETGRWSAGWYRGLPYATVEVARAVDHHRVVRDAVRGLAATQNPDGGWPPEPGEDSLPSCTGLALGALRLTGEPPDDRWWRGLDYLVRNQRSDGTWPGRPEMCGPRPLLTHFQTHTQAFVVTGLCALGTVPEPRRASGRRPSTSPVGK